MGYDVPPAAAHGDSATPSPAPSQPPSTGHEGHEGYTGHAGHGGTDAPVDHGTHAPDTVAPATRTLVLSGFAGVNVAVLLYAFLVRRGGSVARRPRQAR